MIASAFRKFPAPGTRPKGFSLLELVVVLCIIALLASIAADQLIGIRASAERASVDMTIGNIRSALGIKVASLLSKGNAAAVATLAQSSPMELLADPPETYRGTFFGVDPELFSGGDWYFDRRDRTLVYVFKYGALLSAPAGAERARYALSLVFDDNNGNKVFDPGIDHPTGIRVTAMAPVP